MNVRVQWDLGDTDAENDPSLGPPEVVAVPETLKDWEIADWLSDTYGFCVLSWEITE